MRLKVISDIPRFNRHLKNWDRCVKCEIGKIARNHVFARGILPCDVLFVGEAPGKSEDLLGTPFIGKSGKLLDQWINEIEQQKHFSYAITNIVCCRPTDEPRGDNRQPSFQEIKNCQPRLVEFINEIAKPQAIVCLGKVAQENLPAWQTLRLNLFHPAYVLRNGGQHGQVSKRQIELLGDFVRKIYAHT